MHHIQYGPSPVGYHQESCHYACCCWDWWFSCSSPIQSRAIDIHSFQKASKVWPCYVTWIYHILLGSAGACLFDVDCMWLIHFSGTAGSSSPVAVGASMMPNLFGFILSHFNIYTQPNALFLQHNMACEWICSTSYTCLYSYFQQHYHF